MSLKLGDLINRVIDEQINCLNGRKKKRLMDIGEKSVYHNIVCFKYGYFIVEMGGFE